MSQKQRTKAEGWRTKCEGDKRTRRKPAERWNEKNKSRRVEKTERERERERERGDRDKKRRDEKKREIKGDRWREPSDYD